MKNKNVNYLNEVLEIKTKSQINENKLKETYDNLEYVKLHRRKYLDLLDNTDSIDYLKENNKLDKIKKQIIKYNDKKY